jgi:hypothetical protein
VRRFSIGAGFFFESEMIMGAIQNSQPNSRLRFRGAAACFGASANAKYAEGKHGIYDAEG